MGTEIERKFLVAADGWRQAPGTPLRQGYLCNTPERSVRIRTAGQDAWLTVKGATQGVTRAEFEYAIPIADAQALLALCGDGLVEKIRHRVDHAGKLWEVDEFQGANAGLVIAEIELNDPDEPFERPPWLGEEVSEDPRYYNASLARTPWSRW